MVTGQHDTDRLLSRVPWRSSFIVILLSLFSYISSCYTGPHAESISSSTISVPTPEAPTDQAIRHMVTIAADGSLSAHIQEIQKALQAIERRLAPTPPTSQPPQQACSISVNCPADSDRDLWLTGQLQNIERKIDKFIESRPPLVPDSEQCRLHLSTAQEAPDKFIVESTKSITDCVGLLIQRVAELDRVATEQLSVKKNTSATGDPQERPDVKTLVVDNLIQRIDELSKQVKHLKETLNNSGERISPLAIFAILLSVVGIVVSFSVPTTIFITRFMREHYETNEVNIFENFAQLLARNPEQLSEEERHYSKLRFAIFTIFIAISGALVTIMLQKDYHETTKSMHDILPIIGIIVTIVFASFEFAIDWIETEYGYMSRAIWRHAILEDRAGLVGIGGANLQPRTGSGLVSSVSIGGATDPMDWVRCPIWTIYGLAATFWFWLLIFQPVELHQYKEDKALWGVASIILISVWLFWRFLNRCGECFRNRLSERLRGPSDRRRFRSELIRCLLGETLSQILVRPRGR